MGTLDAIAIAGSGELLGAAIRAADPRLAETGRAIPFLAAGVAIGVALLLRAGRSRLDQETSAEPAGTADERPDEDPDATE